jgi:invasion protein IalB
MFFRRAALGAVAILLISSASILTADAADPAPAKPAAPAAAAPETKPVIKKFDVWGTRCDENVKTKALSECHAFVDVRAGEQKQRFMYVGIGYLPKKPELFAFVMTPLGTILPPGVGIDVDGKTKFGAPFSFCIPLGCQAEVKLTDEQLKALKGGKQFEVLFRLMGQGVVKVPVKLDGFSAAIASLPKPKA